MHAAIANRIGDLVRRTRDTYLPFPQLVDRENMDTNEIYTKAQNCCTTNK